MDMSVLVKHHGAVKKFAVNASILIRMTGRLLLPCKMVRENKANIKSKFTVTTYFADIESFFYKYIMILQNISTIR